MENIAADNVVRLGLKLRGLLGLADSRTYLIRTFLVSIFLWRQAVNSNKSILEVWYLCWLSFR